MSPPGEIPTSIRTAGRSLAHYLDIARLAERGKFDLLFMADTNATFGADDVESWTRTTAASRLEPLTLLGAIATVTERIGLVATATTTYFEPFHVARFFASLDQISGGRAGWNLVTSLAVAEAYNFGREMHPHHGDRYARAREFAKVVLGLWDSWKTARSSPTRQAASISIAQSFISSTTRAGIFGARTADRAPLAAGPPGDRAGGPVRRRPRSCRRDRRGDLHGAAGSGAGARFLCRHQAPRSSYGRPPNAIKVMPGVMTVIGHDAGRGGRQIRALAGAARPRAWRSRTCRRIFGFDLSAYPLDGPVPDPDPGVEQKGRVKGHGRAGAPRKSDHPPALQARLRQRGHRVVIGTPAEVADALEDWYRGGAADGFNIMPLTFPRGLEDFVDLLIPELQRRGLFRKEYEGKTLRENLGLPFPENRWAVERAQKNAG